MIVMDNKKITDWDDLAQKNCDDPKLKNIWALWLKLSAARYEAEEGKSLFKRLRLKPWETDDPLLTKAWDNLTAPENLEDLEYWSNQGEMNPCARAWTDKALEECKRKNP